ncbi:MAG: hypothetical protein QOC96_200 [Acidobacteriota bacterium]|jgi:hypothetical protein|nr:hypothetical protein [Acidobacteriota bacterium]
MNLIIKKIGTSLSLMLVLAFCAVAGFAQQSAVSLHGQITDQFGGIVIGATVTVVNATGAEKTATTNDQGIYTVNGLAPGTYTVRAQAANFALYEKTDVQIEAGRRDPLDIKLSVTIEEQKVTVSSEQRGLSTESENNANAIVLKGKDLDALPDDPDDLASALQALAGPSVGPNGGQIYIDGFTGGRIPPKEAIREVRINQNPLNAENDKPGFGRIDILTRPGYDKFHGSASFNFNDTRMNARNPFAPTRAPFQQRLYSLSLSGPVSAKKASFFLDFQRREINDNSVVNALVLDSTLNPVRFNQVVFQPRRFITFSPRFDYAINQNNTFIARYTYSHFSLLNAGVGNFSLPSRAFNTANTQHTFQLTETAVLNPKVIMETRFQFIHNSTSQTGDNTIPTIIVNDAFTGGGSQIGLSFNKESRWELQNYWTATVAGKHVFRFGARLRGVHITDVSRNNFGGTFVFTTLTQYQQALQHVPGAIPTQFTLSGGGPQAEVSQTDLGLFFQDEWRVRPNLTLTYGARYETQSNISSHFNFAPRLFFAWAPGGTTTGTIGQFGAGQPKFVIRGGFGMFYDRFNESGTLSATRFTGLSQLTGENQLRFNIIDPNILSQVVFNPNGTVSNLPTVQALAGSQPQVAYRVANNLEAPYSLLGAVNIERQLPHKFTLFGVFFTYRTRHALVLRDINAPLPGTPNVRPNAAFANIFQWESSGVVNMTQLNIGIRNQLSKSLSIFANYVTGTVKGNTDCFFGFQVNCSPSNSYNLNADYGRLSFFPRHSFFLGGTLGIPKLKIALNPFIIARTGNFFNITTGIDSNGDRLFLDRPAFATSATRPQDLRVTRYGSFDINPQPGEQIIPRNYAEGPGFFSVNLGVSRTIGFGEMPGATAPAGAPQGGRRGAGGVNVGPRGGDKQHGGGATAVGPGGAGAEKRYNLTFSVNFQNLFNRTNLAPPVGNLSSALFGQSLSTLGGFGDNGGGNASVANRRITAGVRFSF